MPDAIHRLDWCSKRWNFCDDRSLDYNFTFYYITEEIQNRCSELLEDKGVKISVLEIKLEPDGLPNQKDDILPSTPWAFVRFPSPFSTRAQFGGSEEELL